MKIGKEEREGCNLFLNTHNKYYLTGKYCTSCLDVWGECKVRIGKVYKAESNTVTQRRTTEK
jgi:hypothetical protein